MTQIEPYANLHQVFTHDLYVMNYVLSEVFGDNGAFGRLVSRMAQAAPTGAKFLIVDRSQDSIIAWARQHLANAGLTMSEVRRSKQNMDGDEQADTLAWPAPQKLVHVV